MAGKFPGTKRRNVRRNYVIKQRKYNFGNYKWSYEINTRYHNGNLQKKNDFNNNKY